MLRQIIIVLLMFSHIFVVAETQVTKMNRESNKGLDILPGNLSIGARAGMGGSVSAKSESEGSRTATFSVSPRYDFDNDYSLSLGFGVTQEIETERFDASNLDITLNLPSQSFLNEKLNLSTSVFASAPTDGRAYRDQSYRGGAGVSGSLSGTVFEHTFPVNLSYTLFGGRLFHKFRRTNTRAVNTEYITGHTVTVYKAISKVSLSLSGSFNPRWDYFKTYKPSYSMSQSLSYRDKGFTYTLSHSNGGSALDYQGDYDNIKPFDDYNSQVNVSIGYRIN